MGPHELVVGSMGSIGTQALPQIFGYMDILRAHKLLQIKI
jgi:hypothetical protein